MTRVARLARICLSVGELERAERFYRDGLGFERLPAEEAPGVRRARLRLGEQEIELARFEPTGLPYPAGSTSADLWFQHFAIVVSDIERASRHVAAQPGFSPISRGGPQRLPPNTGSVTAYKFRDPDGHPLELLQFSAEASPAAWADGRGWLFLGIDHSAISVADLERSLEFYTRTLRLAEGARSLNRGQEQAQLDALADPLVDVVRLAPADAPIPAIELLHYRRPAGRAAPRALREADIAATRLVLEVEGRAGLERDPDGHLLTLIPAAR